MRRTWSDGKWLSKKEGGYDWLYHTARWRMRRLHQLRKFPLCAACLQDNHVKAATVAHHLEDHCGDYNLFFNSPLESLCKQCHDKIWSDSEALGYQRGCDINGKPYKTKPIYIDKNKGRLSKSGGNGKRSSSNEFSQRRIDFPSLNYAFVPRLGFALVGRVVMGMRGRHADPQFKHWRPPGELTPKPITPEAIRIYKRMRQHEREFGPWGDRWWQWNRELAGCLGLFEGMVVYEDPAWGSTKFQQSAVDRFFVLAAKKPKFKYKWHPCS